MVNSSEFHNDLSSEKLRTVSLPGHKRISTICLAIQTQYRSVTDTRTDRGAYRPPTSTRNVSQTPQTVTTVATHQQEVPYRMSNVDWYSVDELRDVAVQRAHF